MSECCATARSTASAVFDKTAEDMEDAGGAASILEMLRRFSQC